MTQVLPLLVCKVDSQPQLSNKGSVLSLLTVISCMQLPFIMFVLVYSALIAAFYFIMAGSLSASFL